MHKSMRMFIIRELRLVGKIDNPTEEDINQYYIEYMESKRIQRNNRKAKKEYDEATALGYLHTDGHRYKCDREGVIDMALVLALIKLDPFEPIDLLDIEGNVVSLLMEDYTALAIARGTYHYQLRKEYWSKLL